MTKSQSITTANNWAWATVHDRKALSVDILCGWEVLRAIDGSNQDHDVAYDALLALLREWVGKRKESLERPIKRLSKALNIDRGELAAAD